MQQINLDCTTYFFVFENHKSGTFCPKSGKSGAKKQYFPPKSGNVDIYGFVTSEMCSNVHETYFLVYS